MRIQLRLSYEARVILEELKLEYLKNNQAITSGEVLDKIFDDFTKKINRIDWEFVRDYTQYGGILANYTSVNPTTLNLNDVTVNGIEQFRKFFNKELEMKKTVYRSYVIRIVLKAFKLEQNAINIYKE